MQPEQQRTAGDERTESSQNGTVKKSTSSAATSHESHDAPRISHCVDDYEVLADIGRGQFGVVQKIRLTTENNVFVWKKIKYGQMQEAEKRQLTQEVQLLQALSHKNVVRYCGKINDSANGILYLIMEFCDGGDLGRYLEHTVKKGHFLPEELVLSWFRQLVDGLHYCHTRAQGKVLHRDLKPQNILLSNKYRKLKLADFGLAKMLRKMWDYSAVTRVLAEPTQFMAQTHVGTPYYMSPEVLNRFRYDEKSDVWSLGCLLHEMTTGLSPFGRAATYHDLCKLVDTGAIQDENFPDIYDQEILNTIKWMLSNNPEDRPTTTELKDSVLYKWGQALQYRDLSEVLRGVVEAQKREIKAKDKEIEKLKHALADVDKDLSFLEESDVAIRKSLRLVGRTFKGDDAPTVQRSSGGAKLPAAHKQTEDGHEGGERGRNFFERKVREG